MIFKRGVREGNKLKSQNIDLHPYLADSKVLLVHSTKNNNYICFCTPEGNYRKGQNSFQFVIIFIELLNYFH